MPSVRPSGGPAIRARTGSTEVVEVAQQAGMMNALPAAEIHDQLAAAGSDELDIHDVDGVNDPQPKGSDGDGCLGDRHLVAEQECRRDEVGQADRRPRQGRQRSQLRSRAAECWKERHGRRTAPSGTIPAPRKGGKASASGSDRSLILQLEFDLEIGSRWPSRPCRDQRLFFASSMAASSRRGLPELSMTSGSPLISPISFRQMRTVVAPGVRPATLAEGLGELNTAVIRGCGEHELPDHAS